MSPTVPIGDSGDPNQTSTRRQPCRQGSGGRRPSIELRHRQDHAAEPNPRCAACRVLTAEHKLIAAVASIDVAHIRVRDHEALIGAARALVRAVEHLRQLHM